MNAGILFLHSESIPTAWLLTLLQAHTMAVDVVCFNEQLPMRDPGHYAAIVALSSPGEESYEQMRTLTRRAIRGG
jgi:hypothetical protein